MEIPSLRGKIRVIQIGDSYDFWVNRRPRLFRGNKTQTVDLLQRGIDLPHDAQTDPVTTLASWIHELQGFEQPLHPLIGRPSTQNWVTDVFVRRLRGKIDQQADHERFASQLSQSDRAEPYQLWLSPAEKALRLLENAYGRDADGDANGKPASGVGNHDNYLALPDICQRAGIAPRRRYFQDLGLYVEHAHRMEAFFTLGANYDGATSGYDLTNQVYDARAGKLSKFDIPSLLIPLLSAKEWANFSDEISELFAEIHDQHGYWSEFARIRLGREVSGDPQPPHIFVIGHTHRPRLEYMDVNAELGDGFNGDSVRLGS